MEGQGPVVSEKTTVPPGVPQCRLAPGLHGKSLVGAGLGG